MQNAGIKNVIEVWPLEDVEEGADVFGECLIEEYLEGTIPDNKEGRIPEGMFNGKMFESLVELSRGYKEGDLTIEQAVDKAIEVITDPENYS